MNAALALRTYLREMRETRASGQATEHSYRHALQMLIEALGGDGAQAINEPKHSDYGAPDFIVQRRGLPIGHIECKDIGENLDAAAESEQLRRYRDALPNLILTDYLDFRWYAGGELREMARLGRFDGDGKIVTERGGADALLALLKTFLTAGPVVVGDPAELARRMAGKTRLLRESIRRILEEDGGEPAALGELLQSYREVLISDLGAEEFADLQAQTAAYGLFAARCFHDGRPEGFTRQSAVFARTTPFLRDLFGRVAGPAADPRIAWVVDDLALLLAHADMAAILEDFGRRTKKEDPVVHFYEDFLAAYDPKLRELRGVYYTPEPVVSYIVRSADHLLRNKFGLAGGLADTAVIETETVDGEKFESPRVLILDPAAGTGTFLREVVSLVRETVAGKGLGGAWPGYVREHLLPRLYGFELLMAPYAICHLKLALEIGGPEARFTLPADERLNVFLTNSLEEAHEISRRVMFADEIAREAQEADAVKRDRPVMVVLGNPPYSGHSANKGKWIKKLLRGRIEDSPQSYFEVDGQSLREQGERNPKWVNNDYVKFIRFAQWRIEKTGEGVLGFVTDHSYLDSPTFRGMRQSLMKAFDEIYLLDLHGNSKKKERTPDGGPDANVFDIQQGVAVGLFVKHKDGGGSARVFHADLWGEREAGVDGGKYGWLAANDIASTEWTELSPQSPQYLFVLRDEALIEEYEAGWKLTDVFPVNSVGIVTARDKLAIQWTREDMRRVASDFANRSEEDARVRYNLGPDARDWKVSLAQEDVRSHSDTDALIYPILYRPFDRRCTFYTGRSRGFICMPRPQVMRHMLAGPNLGLSVGRAGQVIGSETWDVVLAGNSLTDFNLFRRGGNCLFPLYLYQEEKDETGTTAAPALSGTRTLNLSPGFTAALEDAIGTSATLEDVFHYIYAVLHSPEYRRRYADFLKSDFPRVPLPGSRALFTDLTALGARLAALHLMEADGADAPDFNVAGDNRVDRVRYAEPSGETPGRVWINNSQHFEGVSPETWKFTIGGYQPAERWLKGRKGRTLSFDDIAWYRRVCAALAETPRLMQRVDAVIARHGGWPTAFGVLGHPSLA